MYVTANYFAVAGVWLARGRGFDVTHKHGSNTEGQSTSVSGQIPRSVASALGRRS